MAGLLDQVGNGLGDFFSHPFPYTPKPGHKPSDAMSQAADALAPDKKAKVSDLTKKYTDWDWRIATAVSLAESRGKVNAQHKNSDGSIDRGLMQINSVHSQYDANRLLTDPAYNVKAGHDIWLAAGGSFSPWTTYKSGAYKLFLGHDATVTTSSETLLDPGNIVHDATSGIDAIGKTVGALTNPSTWARLGKGALGGTLLIVGVGGVTFIIANRVSGGAPVKAAKVAAKVVK